MKINWKSRKDLTGGLLDRAVNVWENEQGETKNGTTCHSSDDEVADQRSNKYEEVVRKVRETAPDTLSFFSWFEYRGPSVSAKESKAATKIESERRKKAQTEEKDEGSTTKTEHKNRLSP